MKLKKKTKVIMIVTIIGLILLGIGFLVAKKITTKEVEVEAPKIEKTISKYEYSLKENKSKRYKSMFKELEKILLKEPVNDEEYARKVAELFIYDFYTLSEKTSKADVGGVDFIHPDALQNFLLNAEDTYYKYVESNLYGERIQKLPTVDLINIETISPIEFAYKNEKKLGYEVKINWTYTDQEFSNYQKNGTITMIKEGIKYYIVELQ